MANQNEFSIWKTVRTPVLVFLSLFVVQAILLPMVLFKVPANYGAALAFGGSVGDAVYMPGPHLKAPWQHTIMMKLRTVAEPHDTAPTDSNNQSIGATVVPQIWIEPSAIPTLVKNYGSFDSLMKSVVDPQINQATRAQTSLRTPEALIYERPTLVKDIRTSLQNGISEQLQAKGVNPNAVHVGLVAVTQFAFNPAVKETLERKAESQVHTRTANAQAQIRGINADKDGQVTEILADAEATASQTIAEANAYKVKKVGEAAAAAADVAQYEAIQKWVDAGGHSPRVQLGNGAQVIINGSATPAPAPQKQDRQ